MKPEVPIGMKTEEDDEDGYKQKGTNLLDMHHWTPSRKKTNLRNPSKKDGTFGYGEKWGFFLSAMFAFEQREQAEGVPVGKTDLVVILVTYRNQN